ncbi:Calcineurin-like phosphoesterase [Sphingobacterium wenxiniae]|uniref:Calcineurin-like phosphoesterase n=2 Tax=Sphingobacterium wenxiniae TaxID=683125 RepID=A0A1I6V4T6_9SPHI|nr:Calcineurin-like phosphoesterase [Sphingobacterium wenxiniae]
MMILLKKHIFFIALVWVTFCYSGLYAASLDSGYPDQIVLSVSEDLSTSVSVSWRTDESMSSSTLQIAREHSRFNIADSATTHLAKSELLEFKGLRTWHHAVLLEGLDAQTTYVYRVGQGEKWSEWINFTTTGGSEATLKFVYFGDVQSNIKSMWSRIAKQSIRTIPDAQLILYAGDIVNRGNNLHEWEDWFYASGGMHQSIPIMPASGNHDHGDSHAGVYGISEYWNKQFKLPNNGAAGLEGTSYYADVQNVRFVVFNTEMFNTYEKNREDQVQWLEEVLAQNKQPWLIMLFHHPIFSTKKNRDNIELRNLIKPLIDKYKVDLVLQGHDHTYARGKDKVPMTGDEQSHTTYVVSVSGPKMSEVQEADWMDRSASFTQLFHGVEVQHDKLIFSSYKVNGDLLDTFTILKTRGVNTIIH